MMLWTLKVTENGWITMVGPFDSEDAAMTWAEQYLKLKCAPDTEVEPFQTMTPSDYQDLLD